LLVALRLFVVTLTNLLILLMKRALIVVHLYALDGLLALTVSLERTCTA